MKKILTLLAAICLATGSQAQIVSSQSTIKKVEASNTTKYLRLGLNIAGANGDGAKGSKSVILYDFMFGFQKPIYEGLYWGMEFGFSARGFKVENSGSEYIRGYGSYSYKETNKLTAHQIRWTPIQLGYKINVADNFKIDPHVGFFMSGDFAGSAKYEATYDGEKESNSTSIYDINDYRYFNLGGQFGVGVWFNNFNLDFTYQIGAMDFVKDAKCKSHNFLIRLGVSF